jgi:DNA-binding CsgD family transcriptional regulator
VLLLAVNFVLGGTLNIALPLVFLLVGGIFFILVFAAQPKWSWASILYVPGSALLAFGLIFLLNVITNDWNAWSYAWLILLTGIGIGLVLACRHQSWPPIINLVGWVLAISSITLFAVFGAVVGGLFIQVMAPILLVLCGLALYWVNPASILPEHILKRFQRKPLPAVDLRPALDRQSLVEPLSARELEILRLVEQGLSNQQIAATLHIAPSTVKTHINNIYGKLGVRTRVQAINRARDLGLLGS